MQRGGVIREGCGKSARGHVSRASEASEEAFEGGIIVEVVGIISGVPQHASLRSPAAYSAQHTPQHTRTHPMSSTTSARTHMPLHLC